MIEYYNVKQCRINVFYFKVNMKNLRNVETTLSFLTSSFKTLSNIETTFWVIIKIIIFMSHVFHLIMYCCFRSFLHRFITNDRRYWDVHVCFFLASYSFATNYCGKFGLCNCANIYKGILYKSVQKYSYKICIKI